MTNGQNRTSASPQARICAAAALVAERQRRSPPHGGALGKEAGSTAGPRQIPGNCPAWLYRSRAQAIKLECCQTLLRHVSDNASKKTAQCPAATLWCVAQVRSNRAARIVAGVNVYGAVQTGMEIKEPCMHALGLIVMSSNAHFTTASLSYSSTSLVSAGNIGAPAQHTAQCKSAFAAHLEACARHT